MAWYPEHMKKGIALKKSATTGRFVAKPLGKAKAEKFAKIEGVTTSPHSSALLEAHIGRGLKGDALRSAIMGSFATKHAK
jgi:hypothetical protein